ncbi:hypothetical protein LUZ61_006051 [Rhynchospora tenuis]|uniref:TAFII28-like protein domain-containing protein n=1 Tax=Rhynchospora tenuis TaxID=198213 RepID=A0AAD5ZQU0_9POAL|nr:hypothetical protein LUZ61_006051 [Rhynchospora tenuis]
MWFVFLSSGSALLQTFTEEQMKRYEAFRRSGFTKSKLKKVVAKIVENQKVSEEINIVVSALAKMFVGDLVETARVVMTEWQHTGPIRPCHIKEAYRRLKLEGKTFKRTVPPLFR